MGGTPLFGGSWSPILQLDLENWIVFLEVVNLTYHILDFALGQYSPDDPLKGSKYDQVQQTNKNFEHDEHLNIRIEKKIMSHMWQI